MFTLFNLQIIKMKLHELKSFVESFENLFSVGAGGEFNYADSQFYFINHSI